jgi:hypothetical protein
MTTFGDLKDFVLRLIGNPAGEGIEEGLLVNAIASAHDAILPWVPKLKQTTITGDGIAKAFNLPADFYGIEAVIKNLTGEILSKAVFSPGSYYGENVAVTNTWLLLPTGQISFSKTPTSDEVFDVIYIATWLKPTMNSEESDLLEPPDYLTLALALYSAAYVLMPDAMGNAGISPFRTRIDSGNPEHNPVEKAITFLMNLFNQEMNRHPRHQKAQT